MIDPDRLPGSMAAGRALGALHRFAQGCGPGAREPAAVSERCELCAEPIPAEHRHLLEVAPPPGFRAPGSSVSCVCRSCTILFNRDANQGRYRLIPDRRLRLPDFGVSDEQWQALRLPVGLVFIRYSTVAGQVMASYPGAAGPVEAEVDAAGWEALQRSNPVLGTMEPDVEALLINRVRAARQYFVAPIDDCYRLTGLIRARWQGLTGGSEVWSDVERYFAEMERRSRPPRP